MAVRLKDVAEAAGVSIALVSNYVNGKSTARMSDETRSRINTALRRLNYQPNPVARFLRTGESRTVGFLVSGLVNEVTQTLMLRLHEHLAERGCEMLSYYTKNEVGLLCTGYREMLRCCCAGIITHGQNWNIEKTELPQLVMTSDIVDEQEVEQVYCDHRPGVTAALDHLAGLGHRKVICLAHPFGEGTLLRKKIFLERFPEEAIETVTFPGVITPEEAKAILERHPGATAAFCINDMIALAFREALMRLGLRVPEDFSLVGFDNIAGAELAGLSTVDQALDERALSAVNALLNRIENRSDPVAWNIPARFVPRLSCAPPPRPGLKRNPR